MRSIHTEIAVDRPAETVWAILADIDRWAEWNPFAKATGRLAVGERLEVEIRPPGKSAMRFRPTVVKLEPGRELRGLGRLGFAGIFDGEHGFRVVAEDAGHCRFEHFETFGGVLAGPILWTAGKATRRGFEAMNRALKARAESRRP
jgi:hypothetical protein